MTIFDDVNKGLVGIGRDHAASVAFMKMLRHLGWEFDDGECPACIADLIAEGLRRNPAGKRGTWELDSEIIAQDFEKIARILDNYLV
jgi:hypothetical protein